MAQFYNLMGKFRFSAETECIALTSHNKVLIKLFQKFLRAGGSAGRRAHAAKLLFGAFLFVTFSFAPTVPKEKVKAPQGASYKSDLL